MAAPPYDYLEQVYLPIVTRMGPRFESEILSWGFYPVGGGLIRIGIKPCADLKGIKILETGGPHVGKVTALVSRIPESVGEREYQLIRRRAGWKLNQCEVRQIDRSPGPGNIVMIRLTAPNVTEMFSGFGKRGVTAEQVATQAWNEARQYLADEVPVGEHLCDQLLLPMALAARSGNSSQIVTGQLSMHAQTQIDVIKRFLDVSIEVEPIETRKNRITICPDLSVP